MAVKTARRYYLQKRLAAARAGDLELAGVWRSKQEATAATPLPADFPLSAALAAAGYSTVEDIDGASADELVSEAALSPRDAEAVLTALAAL